MTIQRLKGQTPMNNRKLLLVLVIIILALALSDRIHAETGNVTTCGQVGYPTAVQSTNPPFPVTVTDKSVTINPSGVTVYVVVVKGGNGYNVFSAPFPATMQAPLNGGGNVPAISHWFLCYSPSTGTTVPSTAPVTTLPPPTTVTQPTTTTSTGQPTTTTVPMLLPETGGHRDPGGMLLLALVVVVIGVSLMTFPRLKP